MFLSEIIKNQLKKESLESAKHLAKKNQAAGKHQYLCKHKQERKIRIRLPCHLGIRHLPEHLAVPDHPECTSAKRVTIDIISRAMRQKMAKIKEEL